MESSEGRSALTDAAVAMVGFLTAGGWLLAVPLREVAVPYWALAAGIVVVASADASILRRKPRFTTPADRVTLMRAVLVACCATMAVPALLCWLTPGVPQGLGAGAVALALLSLVASFGRDVLELERSHRRPVGYGSGAELVN